MNLLDGADKWLAVVTDRGNPILVREIRRALTGRAFISWFLLMLGLCLLTSLMLLAQDSFSYAEQIGLMLFPYYAGFLMLPAFIAIPSSISRGISEEKQTQTYELVQITALTPLQLLMGRLACAVVLLVVLFSAVAPFAAFTYILGGIELGQILLVLVSTFLISILFSLLGVLISSQQIAGGRLGARPTGIITVIILLMILLLFGGPILSLLFFRHGSFSFSFHLEWEAVVLAVLGYCAAFSLLFGASMSQLSYEGSNRAVWGRGGLAVTLLLVLACLAFGWVTEGRDYEYVLSWNIFGCSMLFLYGIFALADRETLTARMRAEVPTNPALGFPKALLTSGRTRGIAFFLIANAVVAATCLVAAPLSRLGYSWSGRESLAYLFPLVLGGYSCFYLALGDFLRRLIPAGLRGPRSIAVAAFLPVLFALIVPPIVTAIRGSKGLLVTDLLAPYWILDKRWMDAMAGQLFWVAVILVLSLPCLVLARQAAAGISEVLVAGYVRLKAMERKSVAATSLVERVPSKSP